MERRGLCEDCEAKFYNFDRDIRVPSRFFDQVGHKTLYASSGNKHFFTKSCLRQTYQNYEQPTQTSENSNLSKKIFYEEYLTRGLTCIKKCFGKF